MQRNLDAVWAIALSFFAAYLLAVVPLPERLVPYRPEWVPMVWIYWAMALPYRIGIGSAWATGLGLDVLEGQMLGLNTVGMVLIGYVVLSRRSRLRMFSGWLLAVLVLALTAAGLLAGYWLQRVAAGAGDSDYLFMAAAPISALVWPPLYLLLRLLRHRLDR